jgi:hypothetical protein
MSRYLAEICNQLICLLSSERSKAIVWGDDVDEPDEASPDWNIDTVNFTVEKKTEQEENVIFRQGCAVCYLRSHSFYPY